ncbi:hypothetical protein FC43_GL001094 [Limosilactobacillus ingluviei DSM 15946]|uniref:Uncharacterized protein n=1 Tax=Limosilactobacillus ingluviei DSM 15946 TaxID=1423760 RepID=A0A0R1UJQ5_9LACO|nr:hypothetical protein FC43_GL001094 [Limosilactobacillus ingluviei DSM 15946]
MYNDQSRQALTDPKAPTLLSVLPIPPAGRVPGVLPPGVLVALATLQPPGTVTNTRRESGLIPLNCGRYGAPFTYSVFKIQARSLSPDFVAFPRLLQF